MTVEYEREKVSRERHRLTAMAMPPFEFYEGWLACPCGGKVYVILKSGETYPCPKCERPCGFSTPKGVES